MGHLSMSFFFAALVTAIACSSFANATGPNTTALRGAAGHANPAAASSVAQATEVPLQTDVPQDAAAYKVASGSGAANLSALVPAVEKKSVLYSQAEIREGVVTGNTFSNGTTVSFAANRRPADGAFQPFCDLSTCPSSGCCSGGCAGPPGTHERENTVLFLGVQGLPGQLHPKFFINKCSVTEGEPWGQPSTGGSAVWEVSNGFIIYAGRKGRKSNAEFFTAGLKASNMLGIKRNKVALPDYLNFVIQGTLQINADGPYTFEDIRIGQDSNDWWWMGGPYCTNLNGAVLKCKSRQGKQFQFWAKPGTGYRFEVARS